MKLQDLNSEKDLITFKQNLLSQTKVALRLYSKGVYAGKLEYTLKKGVPTVNSVEIVNPLYEKRYKEKLLAKLKDNYPVQSIKWDLTPEKQIKNKDLSAEKSYEKSTSGEVIDNYLVGEFAALESINQELNHLDSISPDDPLEIERNETRYKQLSNLSSSLQNNLQGKSPTKMVISTEIITPKCSITHQDRNASNGRIQAIQATKPKAHSNCKDLSPINEYRQHALKLLSHTGHSFGASTDVQIASSMLLQGHSKQNTQRGIQEASPNVPLHTRDYAQTITEYAYKIPEIRKALKNRPTGMELIQKTTANN